MKSMNKSVETIYALTDIQQGILYHSQYEENQGEYILENTFTIKGYLDTERVESSLAALSQKYEVLRALFLYKKTSEPKMVILKKRIPEFVCLGSEKVFTKEEFEQKAVEEREREMDLERNTLLRVTMVPLENGMTGCIWVSHHIIIDGWCMSILFNDFIQYYEKSAKLSFEEMVNLGEADKKSQLKYGEYIKWLSYQNKAEAISYFEKLLEENDTFCTLPVITNSSQKYDKESINNRVGLRLDKEKSDKAVAFCERNGVSLNSLVETAWGLILGVYNAQNSVVYGKVFSGRNTELDGIEDAIGLFINTVPAVSKWDSGDKVIEVIQNVQKQTMESMEYEYASLTDIQNKCGRRQIFDTIYVFENYYIHGDGKLAIDGKEIEVGQMQEVTNYAITVVAQMKDALCIDIVYDNKRYGESEIELCLERMIRIISYIVDNPDALIKDISVLTEGEKQKLLYEFNTTDKEYVKDKTAADIFEEQVKRTPDDIALVHEDEKITYKELNERANSLAHRLIELGVKPDDFVAIIADRSIEMIEAIYGVIKAGGAYVPVDPTYPSDRIQFMLEDSNPKVILKYTSENIELSSNIPVIELKDENLWNGYTENPERKSDSDNLVYCIYTSGTTGKPKGVMIENRALMNYLLTVRDYFYNNGGVTPLITNYAFDLTVTAIFGSILYHNQLHIFSDERKLAAFSAENDIAVLKITPSQFMILADELEKYSKPKIHAIMIGGEALTDSLMKKIYNCISDQIEVIDEYGPTEATVASTFSKIRLDEYVHIGKPFYNTQIYILNGESLCGIGLPGELCIAGDGLARGYLNRPELTDEKFVNNPFGQGRIYRTGDLARWLPDGNIDYMGRIDEQVKIRGFRIELGEIESKLREIENIRDCAVIERADESGEKAIFGYYISNLEIQKSDLINKLNESLPKYMIPSGLMQIESIPVTRNGKLDKKALPEIDFLGNNLYVKPNTELEIQLCQAFETILKISPVGLNDDFFELGGHSLRVMRLINQIQSIADIKLSVKDVLSNTTPASLATLLEEKKHADQDSFKEVEVIPYAEKKDYYSMSEAQRRIYGYYSTNPKSLTYNIPVLFKLSGDFNPEKAEDALARMTQRHSSLRTYFKVMDKDVVQVIEEENKTDFEVIKTELLWKDLVKDLIKPFNLEKAPLLRVRYLSCADGEYLFFDIHHIISDGFSMEIFAREFAAQYSHGFNNEKVRQYVDYSEWEKTRNLSESKEYWKQQLQEFDAPEQFLTDYPYLENESDIGKILYKRLGSDKIEEVAEKYHVSEFAVFMGALLVLNAEYKNADMACVGTAVSGRNHPEVEQMLGVFVNLLPIYSRIDRNQKMGEFISKLSAKLSEVLEYQEYPVNSLYEGESLFDCVLAYQNFEKYVVQNSSFELEQIPITSETAKYNLTFEVKKTEKEFDISLEYKQNHFQKESAEWILEHFVKILENIAQNDEASIAEVCRPDSGEVDLIFHKFNKDNDELKYSSIAEAFAGVVKEHGDDIAVNDEKGVYTYKEIDYRSNILAELLCKNGVKPGDNVVLYGEKSVAMAQAILAVVKVGAVYIPIDASEPAYRAEFIIADSGCKAVMYSEVEISEEIRRTSAEKFVYDLKGCDELEGETQTFRSVSVDSDAIVYCMYTSGTTGQPKGCKILNKGILRLALNCDYLELDSQIHTLSASSLSFDAFNLDFWWPLLNGGTVTLLPKNRVLNITALKSYINSFKINTMWATASLFNQLVASDPDVFANLSNLLIGGENLSQYHVELFQKVHPEVRLFNGYGPTENTTFTTVWEIPVEHDRISIGRPIGNTQVYILRGSDICGVGIPGEICTTGDGVSAGYTNTNIKKNEAFTVAPWNKDVSMYRTGDYGRYMPDGNIDFIGRRDSQVKINGYRVEPEEVQQAILEIKGVTDAAVVIGVSEDEPELLAYYVTDNITEKQVYEELNEKLPIAMVPRKILCMRKLPINKNGKLDKDSLPVIEKLQGDIYVAPVSDTEKKLCSIFEKVLSIDRIGIDDSFYRLGGDSIKAIFIVSAAKEKEMKFTVSDLLKADTVRKLALVAGRKATTEADNIQEIDPLREYTISTPVISAFLNNEKYNKNYYHQTVFLKNNAINMDALEKALIAITEYHDIFRTVVRENNVIIRVREHRRYFDICEETGLSEAEIKDYCVRLQSKVNLHNGPMMSVAVFHRDDGDHVFILIHHLIVDTISWNIILSDLETTYTAVLEGKKPVFPTKTTSFAEWTELEKAYAEKLKGSEEEIYWNKVISKINGSNAQTTAPVSGNDTCVRESLQIGEETTQKLLELAKKAEIQPDVLLLTAIIRSYRKITGNTCISAMLENHGREDAVIGGHTEHSVGWFTVLYPQIFDFTDNMENSPAKDIILVKDRFFSARSRAMSYGILCEYAGLNDVRDNTDFLFNYLGESLSDNYKGEFTRSQLDGGDSIPDENLTENPFWTVSLQDSTFIFNVTANGKKQNVERLIEWIGVLKEELGNLVEQTSTIAPEELISAANHGLKDFDFNRFRNAYESTEKISNFASAEMQIVPLTSIQKGMMFEGMMKAHSGEYVIQTVFEYMSNLDEELIRRAIEILGDIHPILRSRIYFDVSVSEYPVQIIRKENTIPVNSVVCGNEEWEWILKKDIEDGFELENSPLIRFTLAKVGDSNRVIWTMHHIICDGWSNSILFADLRNIIRQLCEDANSTGALLNPVNKDVFMEYASELDNFDRNTARSFWKNLLEDYEGLTQLSVLKRKSDESGYKQKEIKTDAKFCDALRTFCNRERITPNDMFQMTLAVLLSRVTATKDVVFGHVVSGRDYPIEGITYAVGPVINTVPVRYTFTENENIDALVERVKNAAIESKPYEYVGLSEIQNWLHMRDSFFTILYSFENYHMDERLDDYEKKDEEDIRLLSSREQTNYDLTFMVIPGENYDLRVMYDAEEYPDEQIERLLSWWIDITKQIMAANVLKEVCLIPSKKEMDEIWIPYNATASEITVQRLDEIIMKQIEKTPDKVAVTSEDKTITYRELGVKSAQVANYLMAQGVRPGDSIAISGERDVFTVVNIVGLLRAGGVYIPLNPEYPWDRNEYIMINSECILSLNKDSYENERMYEYNTETITPQRALDELAYVIYTSGSTGKPKGVMITHREACNTIIDINTRFDITEKDNIIGVSAFSFDLSVYDLFGALSTGACYCIAQDAKDTEEIAGIMEHYGITFWNSVPAIMDIFIENIPKGFRSQTLKNVLLSGDWIPVELPSKIRRMAENSRVISLGGATEGSIWSIYYPIGEVKSDWKSIPYGYPLANQEMRILDESGNLNPVDIPGEICISGIGVAEGYMNNVEKTEAAFFVHPKYGHTYRTGDIGVMRKEGYMQFIGRKDTQVKINGFRIELGEIEQTLEQVSGVDRAVALVQTSSDGNKRLVAWYSGPEEIPQDKLREEIAQNLPEYMIPVGIMYLASMPVTSNNKIDRKTLPEIDFETGREIVPPRNEKEEVLISCYREIFSAEEFGVTDSFFSLGGDSIKAIRLVSAARNKGYILQVKDVMQLQTVEKLAMTVADDHETGADFKEVSGEVEVTPTQRYFESLELMEPEYFNQTMLIELSDSSLNMDALNLAMAALTQHYDMLRATVRDGKLWIRTVEEFDKVFEGIPQYKVLEELSQEESRAWFTAKCEEIQASIEFDQGTLFKTAVFTGFQHNLFFITAHHLIVDSVSGLILADEIKSAYESACKNEKILFSAKTDSYQAYAKQMVALDDVIDMSVEKEYWSNIIENCIKIKFQNSGVIRDEKNGDDRRIVLSEVFDVERTTKVLAMSNKHNVGVDEMILTALSLGYKKLTGNEVYAVSLEAHGRNALPGVLNVERTVGWFTTIYPFILNASIEEPYLALMNIKEEHRNIPNGGVGFGALSLGEDNVFESLPTDSFNYLGELQKDMGSLMDMYYTGASSSEKNIADGIGWVSYVAAGKLHIDVQFNEALYYTETIRKWIKNGQSELVKIVKSLKEKEPKKSPYDYGVAIETTELSKLTERYDVQDVYPLTDAQTGMLFHYMKDEDPGEYFIQSVIASDKPVDVEKVREAVQLLADRHNVLKTRIIFDGLRTPVQIIDKDMEIEIEEHVLAEGESYKEVAEADVECGFDIQKDSLIRITVVKGQEDVIIWSMHHLISDGWSMARCISDFIELYIISSGENKKDAEVLPTYADYIRWKNSTVDSGRVYWRNLLSGYQNNAEIKPIEKSIGKGYGKISRMFNEEETAVCNSFATENDTTVNTLFETALGILIQRYVYETDVVFGQVVSGRNVPIDGIDKVVGMFVNTVPVRANFEGTETIGDVLRKMQRQLSDTTVYDHYCLNDIAKSINTDSSMVHILYAFENYYVDNSNDEVGQQFHVLTNREQTNYGLTFTVIPGKNLKAELLYNRSEFIDEEAECLLEHWLCILKNMLKDSARKIQDIPMYTEVEKDRILHEFNAEFVNLPYTSISKAFKEMAEVRINEIAIIHGERRFTYGELHRMSDKLAAEMIEAGVSRGSFVALLCERSPEAVIAMIATLKAGCTYVPIDPLYPKDRIEFVLEDCRPEAILTFNSVKFDYEGELFRRNLGTLNTFEDSENFAMQEYSENRIAYCMYTSGTTGKPKGTLVDEKGILRLVYGCDYVNLKEDTVIMTTGSFAFDAATFEIWGILLNGGKLVITDNDDLFDIVALKEYINRFKVNTMWATASLFNQLVASDPDVFAGLSNLLIGGEKLSHYHVELFQKAHPEVRLFNGYGPTENTTFTTIWEIPVEHDRISIGKPIKNTNVYILHHNKLCGIGVPGELCTTGDGVGIGYLNREELNEKVFQKSPFGDGTMYRTGDLARWRPDGNIEYLGRIDTQIKIRGFRVEPEEVKIVIEANPHVNAAAVIAINDPNEAEPVLCAYLVTDGLISTSDVYSELNNLLPASMVPSRMMIIDRLPLTRNGKLDIKALPKITERIQTEYKNAGTQEEDLLCRLYERILGIEKVGVNDNFLRLGGDSIKAIHAIAMIREAGYQISMREFMSQTSIATLAYLLSKNHSVVYDEGPVTGEVEMTPIVAEFMDWNLKVPNYFNQSFLLEISNDLNPEILKDAVDKLKEHHDMLRAVLKGRRLFIREASEVLGTEDGLEEVIIEDDSNYEECVTKVCTKIQQEFNLAKGPLIRFVRIKRTKEESRELLFICAHHLICDGVSWRILMNDLETVYHALCDGRATEEILPPRTMSYKEWALKINRLGYAKRFTGQLDYWKSVSDDATNQNTVGVLSGVLHEVLSEEDTELLLGEANNAFHTNPQDILIASYVRAIHITEANNGRKVRIMLESHGREELEDEMDISRTIGWFTAIYPCKFSYSNEPSEVLIDVKETLRQVKDNGIGYGILKYLNEAAYEYLEAESRYSFNYHGQLLEEERGIFKVSSISAGSAISEKNRLITPITINGIIKNGKLSVDLTYSKDVTEAEAKQLMDCYLKQIHEYVQRLAKNEEGMHTKADFDAELMDDINLSELNDFIDSMEI